MTELFFDTETSNKAEFNLPYSDRKQPWAIQIGMVLSSRDYIYSKMSFLIRPEGREVSKGALDTHGIDPEVAQKFGISEMSACYMFLELFASCDLLVCHNVMFDKIVVAHLLHCNRFETEAKLLMMQKSYCTMDRGTTLCKLPGFKGKYKWPTLQELYMHLYGEEFVGAHDALADIEATRSCYYGMVRE